MRGITLIVLLLGTLWFSACSRVPYEEIPDVDSQINALGKAIAKYQRSEVWTGGNQYAGCYTLDHREQFLNSGGLQKIVEKAKKSKTVKAGVIALKRLPAEKQKDILGIWSKPIDPTWQQTGRIGKGTTDAGQITEREIAEALTDLVKDMLKLSDEEIQN